MAVVVDTSVLYSYLHADDANHVAVTGWIEHERAQLVTTPLVLCEADHLVSRLIGERPRKALWENLESGAIRAEWWSTATFQIVRIAGDNPPIGLTDASLVALAARHRTTRIATLDQRHFRGLKPLTGEPTFTLLPADAT